MSFVHSWRFEAQKPFEGFWKSQAIKPDYQQQIKWLNENGHTLRL